jgi:hypothetical protein
MSNKIIENLNKWQIEKLAKWHNEFNRWNWPEDLKIFKPKNFDNLPMWSNDRYRKTQNRKTKMDYIKSPMRIIKQLIGDKECLRWHWLHNLEETNEHFEEWYADKNAYYAKYGHGHGHDNQI